MFTTHKSLKKPDYLVVVAGPNDEPMTCRLSVARANEISYTIVF